MIRRVLYAALFVVALPVLLTLWAGRLDGLLSLPAYRAPLLGGALVLGGLALALWAIRDLWVMGRGLPASPFPPQQLVTRGVYGLVPHPIYVGSVLLAAGLALWTGSAGGLWVVTPVLAMMAAAWVIGFERDATLSRFGGMPAPWLRLPAATGDKPTARDRVSIVVLVFAPWLAAFFFVEFLGIPPDALSTYFAWDQALPVIPWTEGVYVLTYLMCVGAPFVAATRSDLRRLATDGLVATAFIIPFYLLVPFIAEAKPVVGDGFWEAMLRWEREGDAPVTAFPSFHVVWTAIAGMVFARRWQSLRPAVPIVVLAVAVSCVTTGMHSAADVVAGLAAYGLVAARASIWQVLRALSERLANSWQEVQFGPLRLASHAIYTGVGASVGVAVAIWLAGPEMGWWIVGLTLAAVAGAAVWAQVVEGSPQLLRPYGYFGSVVAVLLILLIAGFAGADAWLLTAAMGTGGAFAHAIGRVRCLVHGCCHGREAPAGVGICYAHPMTRVVRLGGLGNVSIHPVQVYSLLTMLLTGVALVRLWLVGAPLQFISGAYLILVGVFRFAEEHFRGEPQTAVFGGLRLYQWLAIVFVVLGALLTTLGATPPPGPRGLGSDWIAALVAVGVVGYFAYGADFPRSSRRFSRLR